MNTSQPTQDLPIDAVLLADRILRAQEDVPLSPAVVGSTGVLLCAGASLAAAGLELYVSRDARSQFEASLLETHSSSLIVTAFERLGWSSTTAYSAISQNDQSDARSRKEIIRQMFLSS